MSEDLEKKSLRRGFYAEHTPRGPLIYFTGGETENGELVFENHNGTYSLPKEETSSLVRVEPDELREYSPILGEELKDFQKNIDWVRQKSKLENEANLSEQKLTENERLIKRAERDMPGLAQKGKDAIDSYAPRLRNENFGFAGKHPNKHGGDPPHPNKKA